MLKKIVFALVMGVGVTTFTVCAMDRGSTNKAGDPAYNSLVKILRERQVFNGDESEFYNDLFILSELSDSRFQEVFALLFAKDAMFASFKKWSFEQSEAEPIQLLNKGLLLLKRSGTAGDQCEKVLEEIYATGRAGRAKEKSHGKVPRFVDTAVEVAPFSGAGTPSVNAADLLGVAFELISGGAAAAALSSIPVSAGSSAVTQGSFDTTVPKFGDRPINRAGDSAYASQEKVLRERQVFTDELVVALYRDLSFLNQLNDSRFPELFILLFEYDVAFASFKKWSFEQRENEPIQLLHKGLSQLIEGGIEGDKRQKVLGCLEEIYSTGRVERIKKDTRRTGVVGFANTADTAGAVQYAGARGASPVRDAPPIDDAPSAGQLERVGYNAQSNGSILGGAAAAGPIVVDLSSGVVTKVSKFSGCGRAVSSSTSVAVGDAEIGAFVLNLLAEKNPRKIVEELRKLSEDKRNAVLSHPTFKADPRCPQIVRASKMPAPSTSGGSQRASAPRSSASQTQWLPIGDIQTTEDAEHALKFRLVECNPPQMLRLLEIIRAHNPVGFHAAIGLIRGNEVAWNEFKRAEIARLSRSMQAISSEEMQARLREMKEMYGCTFFDFFVSFSSFNTTLYKTWYPKLLDVFPEHCDQRLTAFIKNLCDSDDEQTTHPQDLVILLDALSPIEREFLINNLIGLSLWHELVTAHKSQRRIVEFDQISSSQIRAILDSALRSDRECRDLLNADPGLRQRFSIFWNNFFQITETRAKCDAFAVLKKRDPNLFSFAMRVLPSFNFSDKEAIEVFLTQLTANESQQGRGENDDD